MLVVGEAVFMAVLAREHAGAGGSGEGVGYETVDELHAVGGDAVEVWVLHIAVILARHHLRRVVVGHDVDDIVASLCGEGGGQNREQ